MKNLVRGISANGGVIVCAIDSTEMVREMERFHATSAVVSAALGRLLTGAALMSSMLKSDEDTISLRVAGNGPVGLLLAEANGRGEVKGYAENPVVELPLKDNGKLNVGAAVGAGNLYVVRDLTMKEPYVGSVPLVSGEIAEDITAYYAQSQQTPTVCALGVLVNPDLTVRRAGGFLLQLLPGAPDDEIATIEANIGAMDSVTNLLEQGKTPVDLIELAMAGLEPQVLDDSEAVYRCTCNKDRFARALRTLGREELTRLSVEDDDVEVKCQFCNKTYHFSANALLKSLPPQTEEKVGAEERTL